MSDLLILAAAIDGLAAAIAGAGPNAVQSAKPPSGTKGSATPARSASPGQRASSPPPSDENSDGDEAGLDYAADIAPLINRVAAEKDRDAAKTLLAQFKGADKKPVTKGPQLLEKDYEKFIAAANELLDEEDMT